jgi:hypothetical protein
VFYIIYKDEEGTLWTEQEYKTLEEAKRIKTLIETNNYCCVKIVTEVTE